MTHRLYQMSFSSVYKALLAKAERKGGTAESVPQITSWLTGYSIQQITEAQVDETLTYGNFFRCAPQYHPDRIHITGKICGVQIEMIEEPLMQEIRRLDKLVDWLAKGKTVMQIIEKYSSK